MRRIVIFSVFMFISCFLVAKSIVHSKHNLSVMGTGDIRATQTNMICVFCHTTHATGNVTVGPLWNRKKSNVEYILYESSTLYSILGQPDGASKLCLSCHDGNIAMGQIFRGPQGIKMKNADSGKIPQNRRSNLGKNISDDHPISFDSSFAVSSSSELKHPNIEDPVRYDKAGKIQCTSCHDPHKDIFAKFLVNSVRNGSLCKSCHEPTGYNGISTHDVSIKGWNGSGRNPWPYTDFSTVVENSCQNCHRPHNAGGQERLLSSQADSQVCLVCHDGNTGINIKSEVEKNFSHNVESYNNIHDPKENILTTAVHTQCVDCHNPHRVNSSSATAPNVGGKLIGVSGMNIGGLLNSEAQYEYEVCLKCHGQDKYSNPDVTRRDQNSNLRIAFLPSNSSFHAVAARGNNTQVPSLRPKWNTSSRIYCTDCHNSNNSTKNGGTGPNGPHGSRFENLLERRYLISTRMPYQQSNYEMCWKCHRPEIVMSENFTTFKYHKKHIDEESTPCSVCHDPHGSRQNVGLINFDTSAVFPNLNGELKFEVIGNKGYCYLQCHGEDHSPEDYEK